MFNALVELVGFNKINNNNVVTMMVLYCTFQLVEEILPVFLLRNNVYKVLQTYSNTAARFRFKIFVFLTISVCKNMECGKHLTLVSPQLHRFLQHLFLPPHTQAVLITMTQRRSSPRAGHKSNARSFAAKNSPQLRNKSGELMRPLGHQTFHFCESHGTARLASS